MKLIMDTFSNSNWFYDFFYRINNIKQASNQMKGCLSSLFSGRKIISSTIPPALAPSNIKIYSYKELSVATGNFSTVNKVGEGGFGSVYKGRLQDGTQVAVKVLSPDSTQGLSEFFNEIVAVSDLFHNNLISLYGCCAEKHHRILVYDYAENNSLAQTLLPRDGKNIIELSWEARAQICIGIAQGLAFLHEEARPCIVHRDIKPSNILLSRELVPKISDFGLAKLMSPEMTRVSTRIAGTLGYMAPEYARGGQLTRKADIYSFGILLLEIVNGRRNIDTKLPKEDRYLHEKTWFLLERNQLVNLVNSISYSDIDTEVACRFIKIGLLCTQDTARLRPSMSKVVKMLKAEMEVDIENLARPGTVSDFMELTRSNNNTNIDQIMNTTSLTFTKSIVLGR